MTASIEAMDPTTGIISKLLESGGIVAVLLLVSWFLYKLYLMEREERKANGDKLLNGYMQDNRTMTDALHSIGSKIDAQSDATAQLTYELRGKRA